MAREFSEEERAKIANDINNLVIKAKKAAEEFSKLTQEEVDKIVKAMTMAGLKNHIYLSKITVDETKRGVFEDKVTKNLFATEYIYNSIRNQKTVGTINVNEIENYEEIAEPIGVIAGITPVTNPTSTVMFKSIIAAKTRNPIIFGFHPSAQFCSSEAARILREAAVEAGAPEDGILWIEEPSIIATSELMKHDGIDLILATGGKGMVKSAYSSGKPALGVGPGNVPCFIEKTANLKRAVNDLVMSKSFDNGMICASEQAVIVENDKNVEVQELLKSTGAHFLNDYEKEKLKEYMFTEKGLNSSVPGKSATQIAIEAGIENVPENTKILVVYESGVGDGFPFSQEKLSPVLAYYTVENSEQGIDVARKLIEYGGMGHTAVIHSENKEIINDFAQTVKVGRIIVNQPSSHGGIGDIYNTNLPSLTLGCGSFGGNSTTANVSSVNLLNIKKVVKRTVNMQWFKVPSKIYFEAGSLKYLEDMQNIKRAFIVSDPGIVKVGFVDKVLYHLNKRGENIQTKVFSSVEPDPSLDTVYKGVEEINSFKPDVIIAIGGGSAMDAAKFIWLFHEEPEVDLEGLKLKFMDIRKRTYKFPELGKKAKFVAIPTTSGTGSEVTSFTVISDTKNNMKYPFADYSITPNIAIIDSELVMGLPKNQVGFTGMDVLTHAMEAYVSIMASDYTDGLSEKAIELVFKNLYNSYTFGDKESREKMHNASTIAGMAFTNAFLGIGHSLAHKIGAEFHLPHGHLVGMCLPHVIRYNAVDMPSKLVSFPKYEYYIAKQKYADISRKLGFAGNNEEELVNSLIENVKNLGYSVGLSKSLKDAGVPEDKYMEMVDDLAYKVFEDQCTPANPRTPLISELKQILVDIYYGNI